VLLTVTTGELRVPGILSIDSAAGLTVAGSLTIEEGGTVAFPAAAGTFKLTIGDAVVITGDATESQLTASGGPVTLSPNSISGNGSTLTAVPEIGSPTITVSKAGGGILTIAGANLDLAGNGSLAIVGLNTTHNKVLLSSGKNPGRITLGEPTEFSSPIPSSGRTLAGGAIGGGVAWGGEAVFPMSSIWYIAATEASNVTIEGQDAPTDTTIVTGLGID
jgi:hypothetical protein